jgi:HK97 family phage portal protein
VRLVDRLLPTPRTENRAITSITPTWAAPTERVLGNIRNAYVQNSTLHAVINARLKVFSEVRFAWRKWADNTTFTDQAISLLEKPWPGATGTELLARMELDASLSGNAFVYRPELPGNRRADRVWLWDPNNVEVVGDQGNKQGYLYWPQGIGSGQPTEARMEEVAHWAPLPHPDREFLGASWVEVVLAELKTDAKMVRHQERFLDNAATPNMVVTVEGKMAPDSLGRFKEMLDRRYAGVENAYKTLVMDSGAKVQMVGADFQQMDYVNGVKSLEARIASAAGVPPIIVGLKAGLDASTYSNYSMAMRAFADHTIRPMWNSAVAALAQIVDPPKGTELWYDDRHVAALRQDKEVEANIQGVNSRTIRTYVDAGFTPESAIRAVKNSDPSMLEHTGLYSVQLQRPGADTPTTSDDLDLADSDLALAAAD